MLNSKKLTTYGSIALGLLNASAAFAGSPVQGSHGPGITPIVEISGGIEANATTTYSPCQGECGGYGTDVRTNSVIRFGFQQVSAVQLANGGKIKFLPILITVDGGGTSGFGHVAGAEGSETRIRQILGAVVDADYRPGSGAIVVRGKLVRLDFDRDKGIFDVRALDASVGLRASHGDSTKLDVEVDVGANIGGIKLNNMKQLSAALDVMPAMSTAMTVNPYAMLRAGIQSRSLKVELIASAEHRVDLTSEMSTFEGRELTVASNHANGTLEVEYTFGGKGQEVTGNRFSIFADAVADADTLTLSNMLFSSGGTYRSFMGLAGVRGQF